MAITQISNNVLKDGSVTSSKLDSNISITGLSAVNVKVNGTLNTSGATTFTGTSAVSSVLIVSGANGQSASLQEWKNNTGTVLAYVNATGGLKCASAIIGGYTAIAGNGAELQLGVSSGWTSLTFGSTNVALTTFGYGNVMIGTTTNSGHKLNVNGTLNASGATTFLSTLTVTGKTTLNGQGALSALGDNDAMTKALVVELCPSKQVKTLTNNITSTAHDINKANETDLTGFILDANSAYRLTVIGNFSTETGGSVMVVFNLYNSAVVNTTNSAIATSGWHRLNGSMGGPYLNNTSKIQVIYLKTNITNYMGAGEYLFFTGNSGGNAGVSFSQHNSGVAGTSTLHTGAKVILEKL